NTARTVKPGVWPFPLYDEAAVRGEFLDTLLGNVRHVDVARMVNRYSTWVRASSLAISRDCDGAEECAYGGESFDATVTRVGDENTSVAVYCNRSWRIKFGVTTSLTPFEHGGRSRSDGLRLWSSREC